MNRPLRTLLTCTIFIAVIATCNGQAFFDVAKVWYTNSPNSKYEDVDGESDMQNIGLDLTYPVQISRRTVLLTGFLAERTSLHLTSDPDNVYDFTYGYLRLGAVFKSKKYNAMTERDYWSYTVLALPRLAADKISFDSRNFQMGGVFLAKFQKSYNYSYRFGFYTNTEVESQFFLPIFGLYYKSPNTKFSANMTLPITADFNYVLKEGEEGNKFSAGFEFYGFSNSYAIQDPIYGIDDEYLNRETQDVMLYAQYEMKNLTGDRSHIFQVKFGRTIGRDFRVHKDGDYIDFRLPLIYIGDSRTQLNPKYGDAFFMNFTYKYRANLSIPVPRPHINPTF